ncbi:RNA polymerase sigma factor [Bacillus sp. FJAT-49736]|uniref:RNA polymerase sigma factor n=1 Tax=Bacillus sp. FJAT-49736 TaxID=2833582 RepID=UPI001BC987D3|nr:RNA polymerase sigma factor [Bacillus sp. FJAT-49736]MBS4172842.1 RNA polymerase sigma factor [Bacillus sp. FJAT-49736]
MPLSIFEPYLDDLKKYCFKLTGTPWDGDDLYQNTITKMLKYSSNLKHHPNPKGYIFKTASNHWRDTIRKNRREIVGLDINTDLVTFDTSLLDSIEALISLLPFKQASSLLLKEYFGFTSIEIAEMLGMTNGGVKAAIHRARTTLSKVKEIKNNHEEAIPSLVNRLLDALKESDFRRIVTTYHILVSKGVTVKKSNTHFVFELYDPDGNVLTFQEKI